MTGLLKERFYCTAESNKLYFAFLVVLAVIILLTGNSMLLYGYALFSLPGFAFISVAGLRKESVTNWSKYKLTFPVRRSIIVDSFYISHAILIVLGMIFTSWAFLPRSAFSTAFQRVARSWYWLGAWGGRRMSVQTTPPLWV